MVLQEMRRDARAASGKILPAVEGSRTVLEMPEVRLQGVRRRGARLRHLDGLERVESLPHAISHRPGLLRRELPPLAPATGPRDRPDVALLHDAKVMARAAVEAVPPRLHPRTRPRRPRSRDASHPGERDRSVAPAQEARRRRDPAVRRGRDEPGRRLPDQRGEDRGRREVRHEALERRALHLVVRGARGREAPALRRMDPGGAEPLGRIVPRGLRGPEPVPPGSGARDFLWTLFAPHYVEMVKARAYEGDTGARWTLHACLRDLLRLLAPVTPFSTDKIWRSVYDGSVHAERFPMSRDGIPASRADFTDGLLAFNADVWKRKRDHGLSLNVELPGVDIPPNLKPFEGDLKRMHHLA